MTVVVRQSPLKMHLPSSFLSALVQLQSLFSKSREITPCITFLFRSLWNSSVMFGNLWCDIDGLMYLTLCLFLASITIADIGLLKLQW